MAETRSDNRFEAHPKPVQEYERRFNGTAYVDWVDFAELEAVYNVAYRTNKYFWVDGIYYQCDAVGSYRAITASGGGGLDGMDYTVLSDASGINVPQLSGKTFLLAVRNLQPYNSVYVQQTGTFLDFTTVGGVFAGETITLIWK